MTDNYNGGKAYTMFLKLFNHNLIEQRIQMDRQTKKLFRIKCIIKKCREKGKWNLVARMCYKYDLTPMGESYYD